MKMYIKKVVLSLYSVVVLAHFFYITMKMYTKNVVLSLYSVVMVSHISFLM